MIVIDQAWDRATPAQLRAYGAGAVCRYLGEDNSGKNLTRPEADTYIAAGLAVVSNYEYQPGNALRGYAEGQRVARLADQQHRACGGPPDRPIYFSVDFDAQPGQFAAVRAYFAGVASVIGLGRTGAYGSYAVIRDLFDAGLIRWGWQTYAWSGSPTRWDPRAQLRQVANGIRVGGHDVDRNESQTTDFGQWGQAASGGFMALSDDQQAEMYRAIMAWADGLPLQNGRMNVPFAWAGDNTGRVLAVKASVEALTAHVSTISGALKDVLAAGGSPEGAGILARIDEHAAAAETAARQRYVDEKTADEQRHAEMVAVLQREHDAQVAALKAQLDQLNQPSA